jgi:hypothetical protein
MQSLQFVRTLERIIGDLKATQLLQLLDQIVAAPANTNIDQAFRSRFSDAIMKSHTGFEVARQNSDESKVLAALNVARIYDTTRLGQLITAVNHAASAHALRSVPAFPDFSNLFEMLTWLTKMSEATTLLLEKEKIGTIPPEDQLVEMELVDYDGNPETIVIFVSTFAELHSDLATVLGQKSQLKIVYLDSGSGVKLGFEMAKPVAEGITKLALQIWEKLRYRRYDNFDREMDSLKKGLDLVETVKERVASGALKEEDGKLLTQKIIGNMRKLIGLGAMLPLEKPDERLLLAEGRQTKLLTAGGPVEGKPSKADAPEGSA